jgi:hypothetical protein
MTGGRLHILSQASSCHDILTGNPEKTFFKSKYMKYTNFGLQKFRIDPISQNNDLRFTEDSIYTFTVPKHADLLMDTYIVVSLPDIYSPIYNPSTETNQQWVGYDFQWIQDIGCQMIRDIEITCGSLLIQKYSGAYISSMIDRDFSSEKKKLFYDMTGNIVDLYNPANAFGRKNAYPSAYCTDITVTTEPSISKRTLYIPLHSWFSMNTRCAFPIKAVKNQDLQIKITLRPIYQLFQVRDIRDSQNKYPYIQPDTTSELFQLYRFLQSPPSKYIDTLSNTYTNKQQSWNLQIHLISTFCFLSKEESHDFEHKSQTYLFKEIMEHKTFGLVGTNKIRLPNSKGNVSSWLFYLQRSDVHMRNEWNNYTNWPYKMMPNNVFHAPTTIMDKVLKTGPGINIINTVQKNTGFFISGNKTTMNQKNILVSMGIQFDGIVREDQLDSGVYQYIEKYTRSNGITNHGLFCYHFGLISNSMEYQPSGAINLSYFKRIELDIVTFRPEINTTITVPFHVRCDSIGNPVSISRKNCWELFEYHYNMVLFEEKYKIMSISNGMLQLSG